MNLWDRAVASLDEPTTHRDSRLLTLTRDLHIAEEALRRSKQWFDETPLMIAIDVTIKPTLYYDGGNSLYYDAVEGAFVLKGQCAKCKQFCYSTPIRSLRELGELIREFRPHAGHICVSEKWCD